MSWSSASAARKDSNSGDVVGPAYIARSVARASAIAALRNQEGGDHGRQRACAAASSRPMASADASVEGPESARRDWSAGPLMRGSRPECRQRH